MFLHFINIYCARCGKGTGNRAMKKRDKISSLVKLGGEILTKETGKFQVEINVLQRFSRG